KLLTQRFEQGGWVINDEDYCTQLSLANNGFDPLPAVEPQDPDRKIGFNGVTSSYEVTGKVPPLLTTPYSSTLTLSGQAVPASSARAKQGEIVFHFGAPNVAVRIPYKVDLSKQPSRPLWLSDPVTLQGEAIFGSSRGNDRIIYRREVMP
ncbi:MSHA biogenesis protein MshQ, partial [Aeromonas salmonicida subsp. achromogenes]